ncbi:MAG: hypothetical protein KKA73_06490 [Chloroflexi bacterium]|nr:hypothetical protein [Chloroflexota bacterium]MBU1747319.1 hypothetical protein [Chloroflexota bacterium]
MEPNDLRPHRQVGLIRQELRGQTYLYDTQVETVHILNPTAGLVWDLCTGAHTPAAMEAAPLAGRFYRLHRPLIVRQ